MFVWNFIQFNRRWCQSKKDFLYKVYIYSKTKIVRHCQNIFGRRTLPLTSHLFKITFSIVSLLLRGFGSLSSFDLPLYSSSFFIYTFFSTFTIVSFTNISLHPTVWRWIQCSVMAFGNRFHLLPQFDDFNLLASYLFLL